MNQQILVDCFFFLLNQTLPFETQETKSIILKFCSSNNLILFRLIDVVLLRTSARSAAERMTETDGGGQSGRNSRKAMLATQRREVENSKMDFAEGGHWQG